MRQKSDYLMQTSDFRDQVQTLSLKLKSSDVLNDPSLRSEVGSLRSEVCEVWRSLTTPIPSTRLGLNLARFLMGSLGMQEIIVIFVLALIIFGPRKLPELGKSLGKGLAEFKKASNELKQTWEDEVRLEKEKESMSEILKDVSRDPKEDFKDPKEDSKDLK